jgi:hypothetical protein
MSQLGPFIFFLIFAFIFYVILFDFSIGALDRYLQLLVLPLTVITTATIFPIFKDENRRAKEFFLFGMFVALILVATQALPHYVPSLYPKSEWVSRIMSLKWNFLYVFSGGSGPLGFYVSFLFISLSWIVSFMALVFAWFKPQYRKLALMFLLPIGIAYNVVFIEEYLIGYWNGHAPTLVYHAVDFIKNDPEIKMVISYNDNGGYEIQQIGKYKRRLYTAPYFSGQREYLNMNKGYYFVLDVPRIDPNSFYIGYFDSCLTIYHEVDKKMSATVYDCRNAVSIRSNIDNF